MDTEPRVDGDERSDAVEDGAGFKDGGAGFGDDGAGIGGAAPAPAAADAPAMTSHRLQLPHGTEAASVLAMVRNVVPEAAASGRSIDLGDGAQLVEDERRPGRWTLHAPRDREDAAPDDLPDSHGYGAAFPEGIPLRRERVLLDLAWSLARRLDGAVVTDTHHRLEPHPCHVRDLAVTSPNALQAEDLLDLVRTLEPDAQLVVPPLEADATGYMLRILLGLPESGDGVATSGAGSLAPVDEELYEEEIHVRVGPTSAPAALSALPWLEDAVDYAIVHLPADETEDAIALPDSGTAARWTDIYRRIGLLAGLIVETVGGYVVDLEGFLVDPADLA